MNKKADIWSIIISLLLGLIALAIIIISIYTPLIKPAVEAADKMVLGMDMAPSGQARTISIANSGTGSGGSGGGSVSTVAVTAPTGGGTGPGSGSGSGGSSSGTGSTGAGSSGCTSACAKYVLDTSSDSGTFTIYADDGTVIASVPALSGQDGYRNKANAWTRSKGAIPPSNAIIGAYSLSTDHISVPKTKIPNDPNSQTWYGAMGPYNYRINNGGTITGRNSQTRDGFLLHQDFDPTINRGTHGCIGADKSGNYWSQVEAALLKLKKAGKPSIPLEVIYN